MPKIWQATVRVFLKHIASKQRSEGDAHGYGATPEKALKDAKDVAAYRKETLVDGGKPRLRQIEDTNQPFTKDSAP